MPSCDGTPEYCPVCKAETMTITDEVGDYTHYMCLDCGYLKDQQFNLWDEVLEDCDFDD